MTSKQKGKPPGFGAHGIDIPIQAALYETTEVLETLQVGSAAIGIEVDEGEGTTNINFDSLPSELMPSQLIGDLLAKYAEVVLQMAQPFPGDNESQVEKRFMIYSISETEHLIMDNATSEDTVISTEYLRDPEFMIGLWYAGQR
ncbi:hypothetical protein FB451DRAFT_1016643, partial [Mycena latifolia]